MPPIFLMPPHPLTNSEIQKSSQTEPEFNGVSSRNNLPKVKDGTYVVNLDKCKSVGIHWITLYFNGDNITYFYSFGVENIPKQI